MILLKERDNKLQHWLRCQQRKRPQEKYSLVSVLFNFSRLKLIEINLNEISFEWAKLIIRLSTRFGASFHCMYLQNQFQSILIPIR